MKYQAFVAACLFFVLGAGLSACSDCDPVTTPRQSAFVRFYVSGTQQLGLRFLYVSGEGVDKPIVPRPDGGYELPLRSEGQTDFLFVSDESIDTLRLVYTPKVVINGPDCGAYETVTDLKVVSAQGQASESLTYPKGGLFARVNTNPEPVSGDTNQVNVQVFLNTCRNATPARRVLVSFFDKLTLQPVQVSFSSVYAEPTPFDPLYGSSDRLHTFSLPISNSATRASFVFLARVDGQTQTLPLRFSYTNNVVVLDDDAGCVLTNASGRLRLLPSAASPEGALELFYPAGSYFQRAQIFRPTLNTNPDIPNVKIYL